MAKQPSIYFAVKLVAPKVGEKQITIATDVIIDTTIHVVDDDDDDNGKGEQKSGFLRIGESKSHAFHGIAGHLVAGVLDFTEAEDRRCKSLAEAERLVKREHKAWLTDAYDWFVVPGYVHDAPTAPKSASAVKAKTPKSPKSGHKK